jgi:membrane protease YdiL (CAAX protease family)
MTNGPHPTPGGKGPAAQYASSGAVSHGAAASAGTVVFALTAHAELPLFALAVGGLLLTALGIALSLRNTPSRCRSFGLTGFSRPIGGWMVAGVFLGIGLAFLLRFTSHQPIILTGLEPFVLTAMAIGAAEELLFRGFIQGRLAPLGWWAAVALAASAHTAYKVALFTFPPEGLEARLGILGLFTLLAGLFLGLLRHRSGSVLPALSAHVVFDILVYGDWQMAPWWIWS